MRFVLRLKCLCVLTALIICAGSEGCGTESRVLHKASSGALYIVEYTTVRVPWDNPFESKNYDAFCSVEPTSSEDLPGERLSVVILSKRAHTIEVAVRTTPDPDSSFVDDGDLSRLGEFLKGRG